MKIKLIAKQIKVLLKKLLVKEKVITTVSDDTEELVIIDETYPFGMRAKRRKLCIMPESKDIKDIVYMDSAISYDTVNPFQPFLKHIQNLFWAWNKVHTIKRALVLGCAGCSLPRFFNLGMPQSDATGIEYSPLMIDVAQKYFLDEMDMNRFHLIKEDAVSYVDNYNQEKFDAIFVDIFVGAEIVKQVMSPKWQAKLRGMLNTNGIVVYNVLSGANTLRKILLPIFPWTGYMKMPNGKSAVVGMNYTDISTVVEWKKKLINHKWLWI